MTDNSSSRIANNTLLLYFRMLLSMIVTLYTSRVVLNTLGVEDFGIYSVVGGIVIALGFLNNAMAVSTQRFLTVEIGKGDIKNLRKVFNMSITIHIVIAVFILLFAETLGLWFLDTYLKIPADRVDAANWVYQFSIFSFILTVLSVPYNALIIANERMKVFAYIGIIEVVLKLLIVLLLALFTFDKLILYSFFLFIISVVIRLFYSLYCKKNFSVASQYVFSWDKSLFKEMGSFAGWNLLGVSAGIGYNQGVNILLNIFFGPTINATRGIAYQVQGAVNSFVANFQIAVGPSITKTYARGDSSSSFDLVFSAAKFSFFLLLLLSLPLIINTEIILRWWLKTVPTSTVLFTKLVLIDILVGSVSGSLQILAQATGNIKRYQVIVSGILLLNLPTSYLFLSQGYSAEYTLFISIFYSFLALIMRLLVLKKIVLFPVNDFLVSVVGRIIIVSGVALIAPMFSAAMVDNSGWGFLLTTIISTISILVSVFAFGLTSTEKQFLKDNFYLLFNKAKS